jgi:hypothetical protein
MSLSPETMTELMALADGELEGEARERAERLAAESEEARQLVEAIRSPVLGTLLARVMNERTAAADGIADAVMAKLEAAKRSGKRDAVDGGVVRLSDARARRGITRGQLAVLGGALVLAATILLYMRSSQDGLDRPAPVASVVLPSSSLPSAEARPIPAPSALAQGAHPAQGVEVDEIDSPAHDVTVFEIPVSGMAAAASGGTPSSVVIMIEDEPVAKP